MSSAPGRPAAGRTGHAGDRHTAPDFSVANLLLNHETDLSRVFAHLLNPGGAHDQGETFLALLLEELRSAPPEISERAAAFRSPPSAGSTVRREQWTDDGESRIDILIRFKDERRIAIENKPWAGEQQKQIPRYLRYLRELACKSGSGPESFVLLYWSGDASEPQSFGDEPKDDDLRDRCITMPYRKTAGYPSVEGWLHRCQEACKAPRVQWFLKDLIRYVVHWFSDVTYLLNAEVETLRKERCVKVERGSKGWLFRQPAWETGDWPGVWIWRQNQESPWLEVGASGWGDDNIRERLRAAGDELVGDSPLPTGTWVSHPHNTDRDKRHVSWILDGDKVFRTDDRERGVKEIMALVEALMEAATTG